STTSELVIECNFIEPLEEDFSDISISDEKEKKLKNLHLIRMFMIYYAKVLLPLYMVMIE
ncbi:MAG: hypothetical protein ABH889_02905, partial [Candidatus Portnoybacteria bacterium]